MFVIQNHQSQSTKKNKLLVHLANDLKLY